MKISIEEISRDMEEEIVFRCHEVDDEILRLMSKLTAASRVTVYFLQKNSIERKNGTGARLIAVLQFQIYNRKRIRNLKQFKSYLHFLMA